jgi:hypothetical protein
MAHTLYKDHTIVYTSRPVRTEDAEKFVPVAVVIWTDLSTDVKRVENLKLRGAYASDEEARRIAFTEAMRWVDRKSE